MCGMQFATLEREMVFARSQSNISSECAMPSSLPKPGLVTDYLKEAKANSKKVSIVGCGKVTFGGPCGFRTHDTLIKRYKRFVPESKSE